VNAAARWFEIARSDVVTASKPLAVRCGGKDLVCYRGRSGRVHVIDGLCPHMGVSFAAHGIIEGEGITCRFHGWNWDGEGCNVWVPTQRRPMAVFDLCSYPVRESKGRVLVRLDP
jgi:phenylpropionate dioxygenase-like ring-hydroxylating dioxygenase large terminal subunit